MMSAKKALFNPFNPKFHSNPYPLLDHLRQEDPIHKSIFGTWIITRYADAVSILNDKRFVSTDSIFNKTSCCHHIRYMNGLHPMKPFFMYIFINIYGYVVNNHLRLFSH